MTEAGRLTVTGHYAGPASRLSAAAIDVAVVLGTYALGLSGMAFLDRAFLGDRFDISRTGILGVVALAFWAFVYSYVSLAVAGRTFGKGIVGLRVMTAQGGTINGRAAFVRTLVLPFSTLFMGLGLLGIVFGRENRALHDLAARTCVVYDWGARNAQLPGPLSEFLARQEAGPP